MAATQKTLTPTNEVISIPAFADKPDYRLPIDSTGKLADAINVLDRNIANTAKVYYESKYCDAQEGTLTMTLPAGLYMFEVHAKSQANGGLLSISFENEAAYNDSYCGFIAPSNGSAQVLSYNYCFIKNITTDKTVTFSYSANWYKISVSAIRCNP